MPDGHPSLRDQGWSAGYYINRPCRDCGSRDWHGAKRAWRCQRCALIAYRHVQAVPKTDDPLTTPPEIPQIRHEVPVQSKTPETIPPGRHSRTDRQQYGGAKVLLQNAVRIRVRHPDRLGRPAVYHIELTGSPFWGWSRDVAEEGWLICGTDLDHQEARVWSLANMRPACEG